MKHTTPITFLLLGMFLLTQIIGLFVVHTYSPRTETIVTPTGEQINQTSYNLPYGIEPQADIKPSSALFTILVSLAIGIVIIFLLMKYKVETFLRIWFLLVVTLAISLTLNAFINKIEYSAIISLVIAFPFALLKVFKRYILIHNLTELLIYPGVAMVIIPYLRIWSAVVVLILISIYDIYAVWHSGFMQRMAHYQIKQLRFFTGFFVPYLGKDKLPKSKRKKTKKVRVNVAILGGGDVVFPIILAGVTLIYWGLIPAIFVSLGATFALATLFYFSEKGKFYPAMPFISAGCFAGLLVSLLI